MIRLLLLLVACSPAVNRCANATLFLAVTLDDAAQAADQLLVDVSIDQGAPLRTTLGHTPGKPMGGLQIEFPGGYPKGHNLAVAVTALASGATVGAGSVMLMLGDGCAAGSLTVSSTTTPALDLSALAADLAAADLSSSAPPDGAADLALAADAASLLDLARPDLAKPDLACRSEDCFNGVDDDCDGLIDCADPDCTGGGAPRAECVPDPGGFLAGVTVPGASAACPADWPTPSPINSDLVFTCEETCGGCSSPSNHCIETIYNNYDASCAAASAWIVEDTCFFGEDVEIPSSHYHSLSGAQWFGDCGPATGNPNKLPPTWNNSETFCSGGRAGGGCAAGSICVPAADNHCVLANGAVSSTPCPANYVPRNTQYFRGFDDSLRSCLCSCNYGPGQCSGSSDVTLFDTPGCKGSPQTITSACSNSDISGFHYPVLATPLTLDHGATNCTPLVYSDADPSVGEETVCCTN